MRVTVEEDPGQVAGAFTSAGGLAVRLTARSPRGELYINPGTVAFWSDADQRPRAESSPEAEADPMPGVTDIWGTPLHKKRRR